ncbi:unnamed protein product [Sympodiomycopsis kandeliae]
MVNDPLSQAPRPTRAVNSSDRNRNRNRNGARSSRNFSSPVVPSPQQQRPISTRSCSDSNFQFNCRSSSNISDGRRVLGELSLHQADIQAKRIRDEKLQLQLQQEQEQGEAMASLFIYMNADADASASVSVAQEDAPATPPSLSESSTTINKEDDDMIRTPTERRTQLSSDSMASSPVTDENINSPRKERQERQRQVQLGLDEAEPSSSSSKRIKITHIQHELQEDHATTPRLVA